MNQGFAVLRQHIPAAFGADAAAELAAAEADALETQSGRSSSSGTSNKSRKVSKVDTLRCAVEYIRSLQHLLASTSPSPSASSSSSSSSASSENLSPPPTASATGGAQFVYGHGVDQRTPVMGGGGGATSLSPSCSDASSPTPSFESERSYFTASSQGWDAYGHGAGYEAEATPNDDELLDAISWWQQSQ